MSHVPKDFKILPFGKRSRPYRKRCTVGRRRQSSGPSNNRSGQRKSQGTRLYTNTSPGKAVRVREASVF